jgi:hypothetical protein
MWGNWNQHVSFLSCSRFNIPRVTWGLLYRVRWGLLSETYPQNPTNPKSPCSLHNRLTPRRTIGYDSDDVPCTLFLDVLMTAPFSPKYRYSKRCHESSKKQRDL